MRKKENIFATTLRIDTETSEGSQAVTWLKSRDKKEYPSYSDLIVFVTFIVILVVRQLIILRRK